MMEMNNQMRGGTTQNNVIAVAIPQVQNVFKKHKKNFFSSTTRVASVNKFYNDHFVI